MVRKSKEVLMPTIVVDTREQLPYDFDGWPQVRKTLKSGDYSVAGLETLVAVERKSHADAWGCVGKSRARFVRCMERLALMDRAIVVIECSLEEFCIAPKHSKVSVSSAVGSYVSWMCKYRVPIVWAGNRSFAERITLRYLVNYWKNMGDAHV